MFFFKSLFFRRSLIYENSEFERYFFKLFKSNLSSENKTKLAEGLLFIFIVNFNSHII